MTATYKAGTAAVSNGSVNVVGTGTAWAVALVVGGMFSCNGLSVPIASIVDDTHLTLDYAWPGTTGSGQSYSILRETSDAANMVDLYDKLSQLLVDLSLAGIHPDNSGSLTKRNALTLNASNDGYLYLRAELGVAFAFYRWDGPSLAWVGPFPVASATTTAAGVQSIVAGTNVTIDNTNPAVPVINASGTPMETAIHGATAKGSIADNDEFGGADSAASYGLKKYLWSTVKSTLWTAWGALINGGTAKATPVAADVFAIGDSAAGFATKKTTWQNMRDTIAAFGFTWSASHIFNQSLTFLGATNTYQNDNTFCPQITCLNRANDTSNPYMIFAKRRGPTGAVQVGDGLGNFLGQGLAGDTVTMSNAAYFNFFVTGVGTGYVDGGIQFTTQQGGVTSGKLKIINGVMAGSTANDFGAGTFNSVNMSYYYNGVPVASAPNTVTANYTVVLTDRHIINNKSGSSMTLTLPAAASFPGRELYIQNNQAQTVVSASSNVVPKASATAGTAILPATNGAWALLVSDGVNWKIMMSGT